MQKGGECMLLSALRMKQQMSGVIKKYKKNPREERRKRHLKGSNLEGEIEGDGGIVAKDAATIAPPKRKYAFFIDNTEDAVYRALESAEGYPPIDAGEAVSDEDEETVVDGDHGDHADDGEGSHGSQGDLEFCGVFPISSRAAPCCWRKTIMLLLLQCRLAMKSFLPSGALSPISENQILDRPPQLQLQLLPFVTRILKLRRIQPPALFLPKSPITFFSNSSSS